jgi:hypothetical protein
MILKIELENFNGQPHMLISSTSRLNLTTAIGVCKANEFLRSLNIGLEVKFENFKQYAGLIGKINEKLQAN